MALMLPLHRANLRMVCYRLPHCHGPCLRVLLNVNLIGSWCKLYTQMLPSVPALAGSIGRSMVRSTAVLQATPSVHNEG